MYYITLSDEVCCSTSVTIQRSSLFVHCPWPLTARDCPIGSTKGLGEESDSQCRQWAAVSASKIHFFLSLSQNLQAKYPGTGKADPPVTSYQ